MPWSSGIDSRSIKPCSTSFRVRASSRDILLPLISAWARVGRSVDAGRDFVEDGAVDSWADPADDSGEVFEDDSAEVFEDDSADVFEDDSGEDVLVSAILVVVAGGPSCCASADCTTEKVEMTISAATVNLWQFACFKFIITFLLFLAAGSAGSSFWRACVRTGSGARTCGAGFRSAGCRRAAGRRAGCIAG